MNNLERDAVLVGYVFASFERFPLISAQDLV